MIPFTLFYREEEYTDVFDDGDDDRSVKSLVLDYFDVLERVLNLTQPAQKRKKSTPSTKRNCSTFEPSKRSS